MDDTNDDDHDDDDDDDLTEAVVVASLECFASEVVKLALLQWPLMIMMSLTIKMVVVVVHCC